MINATAFDRLSNLVMKQAMTLDERLVCFFSLKDQKEIDSNLQIIPVHNYNGMSGLNFWSDDTLVAQLYVAMLQSNTIVIYKKTFYADELKEEYDYYDISGKFFYRSQTLDGICIQYDSITMEVSCPFLNYFYNLLSIEYTQTISNLGNTKRIKFLEKILNIFYKDPQFHIGANDTTKDIALHKINEEIFEVEKDLYLSWQERQAIFKSLKQKRSRILMTKRRAHKLNFFLYDVAIFLSDFKTKGQVFKLRPINNAIGTLHHHTIGRVLWFLGQIRSNLGFSVAMAIYGPFTFYFITQPMNPHAMWAVGKVRSAYLDVVDTVMKKTPEAQLALKKQLSDKVSTQQAQAADEDPQKSYWLDRMSNFKAMQISYESAMIFGERMGRIEQFESQFNFPLTAEAAWMEMEQYTKKLKKILENQSNLDHRFIEFAQKEIDRTAETQLYIWNKMGQFFLDFPYIVVDEENEQPYKSYYVGRQFIFFKKMTDKIAKLGFQNSPITHKNVMHLAGLFEKSKVVGSSVLDTLKKNSKLFRQKELFNSDENRDYMRRQWEVLFIQQNKKQEAASFALQAYTWSIKNAMWLIQTIYSAKRVEIAVLEEKYQLNNPAGHKIHADEATSEYYGNMFHNLVMEYVGIKKEMAKSLPGDNEWQQREKVINHIKEFLIERDKLFATGSVATKNIDKYEI